MRVYKRAVFDEMYIPVPESGCWLWVGAINGRGYGMLHRRRAHRVSYQLKYGHLPSVLAVCHKCDTPSCVNPDHLFLGTITENNLDMFRKGRNVKGSKHSRAKITESDVRQILVDNRRIEEIASQYCVSRVTVSHIKNGRAWKHVPRPDGYSYNGMNSRLERYYAEKSDRG